MQEKLVSKMILQEKKTTQTFKGQKIRGTHNTTKHVCVIK